MTIRDAEVGSTSSSMKASFLRLNIGLLEADPDRFVSEFEESIERHGCALIVDPGFDFAHCSSVLSQLAAHFSGKLDGEAAQSTSSPRGEYRVASELLPDQRGCVSWLKIKRTAAGDDDAEPSSADDTDTFLAVTNAVWSEIDHITAKTLECIARFLWLDRAWFRGKIDSEVLSLQVTDCSSYRGGSDFRDGAENADIISLVLSAGEVDLEVRHRWHKERWQRVKLTGGELLVLAGSMLQRMTNDIIKPPVYRFIEVADHPSSVTVVHLSVPFCEDVVIDPIPECVDALKYPNRYPHPKTARELLQMKRSTSTANDSALVS